MYSHPKQLKSILPPGSVRLTLDDAGLVASLSSLQSSSEMFQTLAEGQMFAASLHPDDIAFCEQTRAWLAGRQSGTATIRLRLWQAQNVWQQAIAAFQAAPGNPLTVLLAPDDLAAALDEEAKMRWIIEGSAQGVIVRTQSALMYANESMARILGYESLAEFTQEHRGEIDTDVHPDDLPDLHAATRARLEGRSKVSQHKFRYRCKNGSYTWLEAISRFAQWKGMPAETSWINDVSERVRAEEELIASKEAAEFANRTKTEFLANMSHELRTPLNAIMGFSEIMKDGHGGPASAAKYVQYSTYIHDSAQHLLLIINDILNLSRLEAGRLTLDEVTICVPTLVGSCLTLMRPRAAEGDVTLAMDMPAGLPGLRADERAVKQIVFNFVSNAIKFTPQGGCVTVSCGEGEDGGFDLVVRDTGIGMSEREISIALAPFGQIDSKLARKHQGTGLGLPICESLMHLHGGVLRIRSAREQGTTMIASFPRERVVRETVQPEPSC